MWSLQRFQAHDQVHPRVVEIYAENERISRQLLQYGHQYDPSWITRSFNQDESVESILCGHSRDVHGGGISAAAAPPSFRNRATAPLPHRHAKIAKTTAPLPHRIQIGSHRTATAPRLTFKKIHRCRSATATIFNLLNLLSSTLHDEEIHIVMSLHDTRSV